ncbi:MAG: VOC family protein [Bdellovibrionaceae bacterium]|nr:VOC family protein [Pseudobdellovibrionaceae bacterium]
MNIELDHINMNVVNLKESLEWYKKIFNFETVERGIYQGNPWSIIKTKAIMLCLYELPNKALIEHKDTDDNKEIKVNHFGLRIDNIEEWQNILKNNNEKTYYDSPVHWPHSTAWYLRDPSGHEIEVSLWTEGAPKFK